MTQKIEGPPSQPKRYRVLRDVDGSDVSASFDTLDQARDYIRTHGRGDWRYIIMDIRTVVWPERRVSGPKPHN